MVKKDCDVLIIGSGVAALQTALYASKTKNVIVVTKTNIRSSNTYLAQGGIAAAHSITDSLDSHIQDTLEAGRYHNESDAVAHLISNGVSAVNEIIAQGMKFDCDDSNQLIYGLEGAHSVRRILHSKGDATGRELMEFLIHQIQASQVEIHENEMVMDLILSSEGTCIGAVAKNEQGALKKYYASHVVIASGGCGMLYPYSTNSKNATGDGFALAIKAGARLKDMEFVQFHPTGLHINGEVCGLVSEAVRGEGANLINGKGEYIMEAIHPLRDLAPRHIVAQTIFAQMKEGEEVFLDISMISHFENSFPTITALCEQYGLNWKQGKIPVAPASHFIMGGIETDEKGRTNVQGLYAVGEAACTGVHGANRLASNSLLEGLVYGRDLGCFLQQLPRFEVENFHEIQATNCEQLSLPSQHVLKKKMFEYAGIVRNEKGLLYLSQWLQKHDVASLLSSSLQFLSKKDVTTAFMILTANSIVNSALLRKESRGAHFRSDVQEERRQWQETSIIIDQSNVEGTILYEPVKA